MSPTTHQRDRETTRTAGGVRLSDPQHWAVRSVHAHRSFTGEHTLTTWCGLVADLQAGDRHTTDLISCQGCGQASLDAYWGRR